MSKLEEKILDALNCIGYDGPLLKKSEFPIAVEGGPKNVEYTKLVNFLTNEIRTLQGIDEEVNAIGSPEDYVSFIMELTSFLKELNCPYQALTRGHVSDRLQHVSDRLLLLDYLLTEVMCARILQQKRPGKKIELKLQETPEAKDMRLILQTLRFPKPPANISVATLFQKLGPTIPIVINKAGSDIVGKGIFNGFLSEKQWGILTDAHHDLNKEYKIRREMLLTRLDVTIQSFQWSDRTRGKDDLFEKIYHDKRRLLKVDPTVDLSDFLAARTDLAIIEKTSNSSVRKNTRTKLNKVIIGQVPDRGGRTSEIAPPPPEMPSWQQRSSGPGGRGGGGNFNRGGGGNFNRGGGGNFSRGAGTYSRGGGNSYSAGGGSSYSAGGGNSYSGGANSYSSGGNSFSGGNYKSNQSGGAYKTDYTNKSFDSSGSYGLDKKYGGGGGGAGGYSKSYDSGSQGSFGKSSLNSGGYDRSTSSYGGGNRSFDSNKSYDNNRSQSDSNRSYDNNRSQSGSNRGYDGSRRDSGGSYSSSDFQQTKRAKTYDSFQANKSTYADQYVQDSQNNQQYYSRGNDRGSRGRGRSSYQRGSYR